MEQKLRSILLVDDDEVTNFINVELIEEMQVTEHLKVCENGKEAMEYLEKAHAGTEPNSCRIPDLIFLDLNMPVMNGLQFLEAYKERFTDCATIITMLSTTQIQEEVFQTLMATNLVVSFIEKPLTQEKVLDLVNGILRVYYHKCEDEEPSDTASSQTKGNAA